MKTRRNRRQAPGTATLQRGANLLPSVPTKKKNADTPTAFFRLFTPFSGFSVYFYPTPLSVLSVPLWLIEEIFQKNFPTARNPHHADALDRNSNNQQNKTKW